MINNTTPATAIRAAKDWLLEFSEASINSEQYLRDLGLLTDFITDCFTQTEDSNAPDPRAAHPSKDKT